MAGRAFGALMSVKDAFIFAVSPPPIPELGSATGFNFRLQDRGGVGRETLLAARNQMLGMAGKSKVLAGVRPDGLEDAPQLRVDIDRDKAAALGVGFDAIGSTLSTALGSSYVNDFPNAGRLQRVIVQADPSRRMQPEDLLALTVQNARAGGAVLGLLRPPRWISGAMQAIRFNGYPSMRISPATRARLQHRRRAGRDGAARRSNCLRASASSGPACRAKKSFRAARRRCCWRFRCWPRSCAWPRCTRAGPSRSPCCWPCRWA
jgi:multidrug efflux pump subunit AcrB